MSSEFPTTAEITADVVRALKAAGVDTDAVAGNTEVRTPITGEVIFTVRSHTEDDVDAMIADAAEAFTAWREVPAPVRGRLVKRWGELLTEHKEDLATLVTAEVGKITSEALGEVQEMIDITDLAVGQSRQLFGKTMPSERPGHRLMETWHPLGVVGIISAFNFPVAVYAWNTALALVAGDTVVWKPAEATLLSALATDALLTRAAEDVGAPAGVHHLVLGGRVAGRIGVEQGDAVAGGDLVEDVVVLAEERVRGARMDQAEYARPATDQRAGVAVGPVAEHRDGLADPIGRRGCDRPRTVVDHVADDC